MNLNEFPSTTLKCRSVNCDLHLVFSRFEAGKKLIRKYISYQKMGCVANLQIFESIYRRLLLYGSIYLFFFNLFIYFRYSNQI